MKETTNIKRYFTKIYNKDDTVPFAWYNTEYKELTEKGIKELKEYSKKEFIRKLIIVNGIEMSRPQRTFADMPEWFRPISINHHFDGEYHNNSFIFIIYNSEWGKNIEDQEIQEAVKSFPKDTKIIKIEKGEEYV